MTIHACFWDPVGLLENHGHLILEPLVFSNAYHPFLSDCSFSILFLPSAFSANAGMLGSPGKQFLESNGII